VKLLGDAQRAIDAARSGQTRLSGELRVTSTLEFGIHAVIPALAAFAKQHVDLAVDFSGSTGLANLVAERFDLAIRLGRLDDSGYHATTLGSFDIVLVASPDYVRDNGVAKSPQDLERLRWIVLSGFDQRIRMTRRDGAEMPFAVPFRGAIQADSAEAKRHFTLAGAGIAVLPEWIVQDDLRDKRLSSQEKFTVNSVPKPFVKDRISSSSAASFMTTKRHQKYLACFQTISMRLSSGL
jgi:DNA-binding transcriptional LysR family regulator